MDGIIINELSLNGQFLDSRDFWKNGMPPFHKALQDALSHGVGYLFKQGSFLLRKLRQTRLYTIC